MGVTSGLGSMGSAASRVTSLLNALNSTTGRLTLGAAAAGLTFMAFAGLIKVGASGAVELQDKLLMLRQALQANSDAMPVLTNAVNDLGVKTVYSSSEAADAFARLVRMGFNASQVMYGAGAAADEYSQHAYNAQEATHGLGFEALALGQALKMDAVSGATLAGSALEMFNQQVKNSANPTKAASEIINDLAGAYLNGAKSGADLQSFLTQVGPTAASMNIQFKDLVTTGDVLAQSMGGIGIAGTRLRYFLATLVHPTKAQGQEMTFLGMQTVDTGSKFDAFAGKLEAAGAVSAKQVQLWKGSQVGLENLFKAAQKAGMVPLDQNFMQWALSTGMMTSKLYDSHGAFLGTKNAVDQLIGSLQNKTPEERMQALALLFNVRGGDAGRILASMTDFNQQYQTIWDRIGKTDVVTMAMQQLDTFKGAVQAFSDSLKSSLAVAFLNLLPPITSFVNVLNGLLEKFLNAPPAVQTMVGVFLLVGAAVAGLTTVVLGGIALFTFLATAAGTLGVDLGILAGILFGVPAAIVAVSAGIVGLIAFFRNGGSVVDWVKQHIALLAGVLSGLGAGAFIVFGGHVASLAAALGGFLGPMLLNVKVAFQAAIPMVQLLGRWFLVLQQNIGPVIGAIIGWVKDLGLRFLVLQQNIGPILANLARGFWNLITPILDVGVNLINLFDAAGGIQGILAALWGSITTGAADLLVFLAPAAAVVAIAVAIGLAVAGVVIQFQHWWNTSSQFRNILMDLWSRLQALGGLLMGQLQQAFKAMQGSMGNMQPVLKSLHDTWVAIQPVLQIVGAIIIGVVVVALGILIAVLRGVIMMIGPVVTGIIGGLAGALQFVAGVIQFVVGLFQFIIGVIKGLFTGDWSGMLAGLQNMKAGALNIWNGLVGAILSILGGLWGAVSGFISGFVGGIIDWFTHLWDVLVGHSIVPDMVNAIVMWLTQMPGRILGAIIGFIANVISGFQRLGVMALSAINNLVNLAIALFLSLGVRALSAIITMVNLVCNAALLMEARVLNTIRAMVDMAVSFFLSMALRAYSAFTSMVGNLVGAAQSLASRILGALSGLPGQMFSVGHNIISGLINGIASMAGAAANAARNAVGGAINAARNTLGINSPSKVFHDIGAGTVEGFVNGLQANGDKVHAAYGKAFAPGSSLSVLSAQVGNALNSAATVSAGNAGNVTIPVYIGNDKVAQVVLDRATNKLKQSGVSRMRR